MPVLKEFQAQVEEAVKRLGPKYRACAKVKYEPVQSCFLIEVEGPNGTALCLLASDFEVAAGVSDSIYQARIADALEHAKA